MQDPNILTIATSLPVQITPSASEIVFCPESNSYALSLGVKVQLPIQELVEVLLKFNAEQAERQPVAEEDSNVSQSLMASLPEASPFSFPESHVYTPKNGVHAEVKRSRQASASSEYPEDDFSRVPIHVARQDPCLQDYRDRSMWREESGVFFRSDHAEKQGKLLAAQARAYEIFEKLPVKDHFLSMGEVDFCGEYPMEMGLPPATSFSRPSSTKLSADAPVFTPGSAFASTQGSESGMVRQRALSADTVSEKAASRQDRVMSAASASFLPASALAVTHEAVEEAIESPSKQMAASFWNRMMSSSQTGSENLQEEECKQM